MKRTLVIHPFLFALYPILALYVHNIDELLLNEAFLPVIITVGMVAIFWFLLQRRMKDIRKTGLLVSLLIVFFFSYGHVYNLLQNTVGDGFGILRHRYFLPLWCFLFFGIWFYVVRTRRDVRNVSNFLNISTALLVVFSLATIGIYESKRQSGQRVVETAEQIETEMLDSLAVEHFPDIYYIIFDRYASSSTLREFYGFDNHEFLNYLSEKGFYIGFQSRCNYPSTYLSLASSLNMEYLHYLASEVGETSRDKTVVFKKLQDYNVWRFLKARGYTFVHFESRWGWAGRRNRYADINIKAGFTSDFSWLLLYETTIARAFFERYFPDTRRTRILNKFEKLAQIPAIEEPTFVFAHMLVPHPPFIFDRNGNPPTAASIAKGSPKQNYVNQLIFTNTKIEELVDQLLSESKRPPVIILQSDEGPRVAKSYHEESEHIDKMGDDVLEIRARILNAYYLPGVDKSVLYESITPVNTFRLIFNLYFGTDYDLLPDYTYISQDAQHPYIFINITDRVVFY
jgi:hypothetical protein